MNPARCCRAAAFCALLVAAGPLAAAEYDAGRFVVHYAAVPTQDLAPAVAEAYGIARSASRALLNVSVVAKVPRTLGTPIPALVQVVATDGEGRMRPVPMRRVTEPPSIYYLGEVTVADRETLSFELTVLAEGETAPIRLRLQQQFFAR